MTERIYILGGYQSDFSRNWSRNGQELFDGFRGAVQGTLQAVGLEPEKIEVANVAYESDCVGDFAQFFRE